MTDVSIKKTLYISTTAAASFDSTGYNALSWTQIKGIASIGQIGFNHATIDAPDLESGITETLKGAQQGGSASIAYRTLSGDAGQAAVATANDSRDEVSIQVVDPDGTNAKFWTGIIHSLIDNEATTTSYEGQTFTFVPNHPVYSGAAKKT